MRIDFQDSIPTHIAFAIFLLFSLAATFVIIHIGEKIILDMPNTPYMQQAMQVQAQIHDVK